MIRTRDFLLYVLVLGFLLLGAIHTGFSDRVVTELQVVFTPTIAEAPAVGAYRPAASAPGTERWQELQAKLAAGEGYLASAPADFVSVDQRAIAEQQTGATSSLTGYTGERVVQWCSTPLPSPVVATWPETVRLDIVEGQRIVEYTTTEDVTTGSTTESRTVTDTVVTLPVRTVRSTFDSCIPDTLIGVTAVGQPLSNTTRAQYSSTAANQVVGYTRDGFTLYGPLPDSSLLDACGGLYVNGQYQYHIRTDEPFILGCYAGVPIEL